MAYSQYSTRSDEYELPSEDPYIAQLYKERVVDRILEQGWVHDECECGANVNDIIEDIWKGFRKWANNFEFIDTDIGD